MKKAIQIILVQTMVIVLFATPAFSKSPINVVREFIKAAKTADFKTLARLSCKNKGPFLTVSDAQKLDLSDIGLIQKIVREEKSEVDSKRLHIVVARVSFFGKMGFRSFFVFKTSKGWKVHVSGDIIKKYPVNKLSVTKTAFNFYYSNKIYLDTSLKLARGIVKSEPNSVKARIKLGRIYYMKGRKDKAFAEYAKAVKIDKRYAEKRIKKKDLISVWKILLKDPDKKIKYYAAEKLYKSGLRNEVVKGVMIEKYKHDLSDRYNENTLRKFIEIAGDKAFSYIIENLKTNFEESKILTLYKVIEGEKWELCKKGKIVQRFLGQPDKVSYGCKKFHVRLLHKNNEHILLIRKAYYWGGSFTIFGNTTSKNQFMAKSLVASKAGFPQGDVYLEFISENRAKGWLNTNKGEKTEIEMNKIWQMCFKKLSGKTWCIDAIVVKKTPNSITISYSGGKGVMEGTSIDGNNYNGEWKDRRGWGKWDLQFASSDRAEGWSDDKGKGEKKSYVLRRN